MTSQGFTHININLILSTLNIGANVIWCFSVGMITPVLCLLSNAQVHITTRVGWTPGTGCTGSTWSRRIEIVISLSSEFEIAIVTLIRQALFEPHAVDYEEVIEVIKLKNHHLGGLWHRFSLLGCRKGRNMRTFHGWPLLVLHMPKHA